MHLSKAAVRSFALDDLLGFFNSKLGIAIIAFMTISFNGEFVHAFSQFDQFFGIFHISMSR